MDNFNHYHRKHPQISLRRQIKNNVCIGMPRCGTTFLYSFLANQAGVCVSKSKEVDFFNLHFDRGLDWYYGQFEFRSQSDALVDISVNYCLDIEVVKRVLELFQDVCFILCVRSPSALLSSLYGFSIRRGIVYRDFESFLRTPVGYITGPSPGKSNPYGKLSVGEIVNVAASVDQLLNVIESDKLLVLPLEYLSGDAEAYFIRLSLFFGLEFSSSRSCSEIVNPGAVTRLPLLTKFYPYAAGLLRTYGFSSILGVLKRSSFLSNLFFRSVTLDVFEELPFRDPSYGAQFRQRLREFNECYLKLIEKQ